MRTNDVDHETWDIITAANYLKCSRGHALKLAQEGKLPGAKIGRCWVFQPATLKAWLANQIGGAK